MTGPILNVRVKFTGGDVELALKLIGPTWTKLVLTVHLVINQSATLALLCDLPVIAETLQLFIARQFVRKPIHANSGGTASIITYYPLEWMDH